MTDSKAPTIICVASFFKGNDFIRECKRLGADDPEIVCHVRKPWHVGLTVRSPDHGRVVNLLTESARRFSEDFTAVAPPEETAEQHL
jgi:hypothetical protein